MKKKLNTCWNNIIKYIYTNRLFISYFILALIGATLIRKLTITNTFIFKPFITDIGIILLLGAFGYLFKPKNQFKYFFTLLIIFTIAEVINSVYYTFYEDFASVSLIAALSQVGTVTDSIYEKIRIIDFIYILQPIIFYYIHKILKNSSYYNYLEKIERKKTIFVSTLVMSIIAIIISFSTANSTDFSRLNKQWYRAYLVDRFGILLYQGNDIFQTIVPKINSLFGFEDAYQLFNDYFDSNEEYRGKNKYSGILEGYNVVYVHMESMQTFLMDLKFNGVEVAPNLKKLASEGMFFSNFYPQVSTGTSSDAEYLTLTGLMPSNIGTVFMNYKHNTFRTIATLLRDRGYYTFSMHGNSATMWGRYEIHPKLGYTDMYFRDTYEYTDDDVVGLGINDKMFFEQSIMKLEKIEQEHSNYFGTIITLSNHSPFKHNDVFTLDLTDYYKDETGEEKSSCYLCGRNVGNYIVSSHYADEALGLFMEEIKNSDYFDNTVFVFYGDHDAKISYKDMNYLYNYDYLTGELKDPTDPTYINYDSYDHALNKKTPLIIWTKNKKLSKKLHGEIKYITGMYDLAPTLYNMLNIDNKYVLGHDIFNIKNDNIVIFPDGNFLTNKVYYNSSTSQYKVLGNSILDDEYIKKNADYTERVIDIGNAIITYDLFNEEKIIKELNKR